MFIGYPRDSLYSCFSLLALLNTLQLAIFDYSLKVTKVHNFMKIVEITQFLRNSACHVTPIKKILANLESRSQELENELLHDYVRRTLLSRSF